MKPGEPLVTTSAEDTERVGAGLAERLEPGDVVLLEGDLAAGKTTFVRGLVRRLAGPADEVSSPSFVLIQTYECAARGIERLHHVDLYRLADRPAELMQVGLEDLFADPASVTAVEWPSRSLSGWLPPASRLWHVQLEILEDDTRRLEIAPPHE